MLLSEVFFDMSKLSNKLSSISGITGCESSVAGSILTKSEDDVLTGG